MTPDEHRRQASLRAMIDAGYPGGRVLSQDGDHWVCWSWQRFFDQPWPHIDIAAGEGPTATVARDAADAGLAEWIAKHEHVTP